jgi:hypothetical protein
MGSTLHGALQNPQGYSIAAIADTKDKVTIVLVDFEYQKKQKAP